VKITKRQLRRIIREEKSRLMSEMQADDSSIDALWEELTQALKGTNLGVDAGAERDEIYIMTGGAEGITVKVMRRGR